MAQVSITVCDKCGNPNAPTRHFTVTNEDGETAEADLCMRHSGPLDDLIASATGDPKAVLNPAGSAPTRRRGRTVQVTSIEDIEKSKQPTKRASAKRSS